MTNWHTLDSSEVLEELHTTKDGISVAEAQQRLQATGYNELKEKKKISIPWGKDLRTIEEDRLSELFDTPIMVRHYPKIVKAFYMKEVPGMQKGKEVVMGFDMIAPEGYGELVGGSQREESIEKLKKNLRAQGEDPSKYEFYFDTRRYGSVPHGGFGMGVERVISWICGLETIKDAIAFPRTMTRWSP